MTMDYASRTIGDSSEIPAMTLRKCHVILWIAEQ